MSSNKAEQSVEGSEEPEGAEIMERSERYRVKRHIYGGGLALREGQIVEEAHLRGYARALEREGGIERVNEDHCGPSSDARHNTR